MRRPAVRSRSGPFFFAAFLRRNFSFWIPYCLTGTWKPIWRFLFRFNGCSISLIFLKTTLNFSSYFSSRALIFLWRCAWCRMYCRILVKVRMIWIFTCIALLEFKIEESIKIPCSVNTLGLLRVPPQLDIPNCDIKFLNSLIASNTFWNYSSYLLCLF